MGPASPQPLAWGAIEAYADRLRYGTERRMTLHEALAELDREWRAEMRRAAREAAESAAADRGGGR